MAKEYPIQNVSFRGETDNFLTEAGGGSELPKWVNDTAISVNAERVYGQLELFSELFSDANRTMPVLTEITLNKKATAKSHRPAVRKMMDVNSKRNVLGVTSVGKILVKIDTANDLKKMERGFKVVNTDNLPRDKKIGLSAIENISRYKAVVDDSIQEDDRLKLQLVDYLNSEYNHRSRIALSIKCKEFGVELEELNYASSLRLFSLEHVSEEALKAIASMDCVLAVRKMPTIEFEAAPDEDNSSIEVMTPLEGATYPVVGLLDSGVGDNDYLRPWMIDDEDNIADLEDEDINRSHGTAVASVINYGDFLENKDLTKCGPCKIKSCIVNTDRTQIYENELVANIQNAIAKHPDIKIWNLSQGTTKTIDNDRYSDLGIALDSLQKDNRILICKSAGNVDPKAENQRITDGADSLLSLVVGSIAHKKTTNNDADENDRSPFSRIGPGVENAVKPDLVHYGGNMDTHLSLFSEWGRQFCRWSGTSFSTPRITALAANLNQMIGGECNPLLLKALLIHNSEYPVGLSKTPEELRREMGYCQSQVDVLLETYDHVEHVQLGEGMMRNESRTSKDAVNVLNASIYSSKAFKKEFAEERMLIEQGDKYQPIKKYYVDLSKMTDTNRRKALGENRKWALKLTGLYRDAAVQALERDGEVLSQDVVVVVTIKDPRHRGTIYTECLDLLEQRGYVHNDINIHNDIRVDN